MQATHIWLTLGIIMASVFPVFGQATASLMEMSIEELMQIKIVSVSKREQKISDTAAAVSVITADDIRRAGALTIPDALRMVPGVEVAHINANKWAISIRGFNGLYSNKLLVLIDGRSVYTPLFSGVYWDIQDTMIEDIERIEVVRGPGGSLWGANAVNGVINVVTKHASETQGGLITAGGGSHNRAFGALRYGVELGDNAWLRLYGKDFKRTAFKNSVGNAAFDEWRIPRGGMRLDWNPSSKSRVRLSAEAYKGYAEQSISLPSLIPPYTQVINDRARVSGGFMNANWAHDFSENNDAHIQFSYERSSRREVTLGQQLDIFDIDAEHHMEVDTHNLTWGLGYHLTRDRMDNSLTIIFSPTEHSYGYYSWFVQDEISFADGRGVLTLGSKFLHDSYTGFDYQPSGRIHWNLSERQQLWGAVSRVVQTPSRLTDMRINFLNIPPATVLAIMPSDTLDSQKMIAYEVGWRAQPSESLSLDMTGFYHDYKSLITNIPGTPFFEPAPRPHLVLPLLQSNQLDGHSFGAELEVKWQAQDWWRLIGVYGYQNMNLKHAAGTTIAASAQAGNSPRQSFSIRSQFNLPSDTTFDMNYYYTGKLRNLNVSANNRVDLRLAWRPVKAMQLSLVVQNLLDSRTFEFSTSAASSGVQVSAVPRSVYSKIEWEF